MPEQWNKYDLTAARRHGKPGRETRPKSTTVDLHAHVGVARAAEIAKPHLDIATIPLAHYSSAETKAVKTVFGAAAKKVAISSTKSAIGHTLGASGGIELVITALALTRSHLPPTINYDEPDPECDLDYVPNVARRADVRVALKNSFGFGGQNSCLVLARYEP